MAGSGFENDLVYAITADFSNATNPAIANGLQTDLQIWMGDTAGNANGSHTLRKTVTPGTGINFTGTSATNFVINSTASSVDLHVARYIVSAGGTTDGANYTTIATAYAAALAAGAPQTVFVQPGTYTEDLTLSPGISISAFNCDSEDLSSNVIIAGKLTATFTGSCAISGIELRTNGDFALSITGTNATTVRCFNCFAYAFDNNALELTSSNASSKLEFYWSQGDLVNTFAYFTHSGAGKLAFFNSVMGNNAASTAASTVSGSGAIQILHSYFANAITSSGTSVIQIGQTEYHGAIIAGGTGPAQAIFNSSIDGGTASSVSIGAGVTIPIVSCPVSSTNTNAITGAGTLQSANLSFSNTSSTINTTTQTVLVSSNDAMKVTAPGAYPYTVLKQDALVIVDTSAARTINLPATPQTGEKHVINDNVGSALANNITVQGNGANINAAASYTMNVAYGSATFAYNGTTWSVI